MKIKYLKMKASFILTLFCVFQISALESLAQKFNIDLDGVKVTQVIEQIKEQSDYKFFYKDNVINEDWKVDIHSDSEDINEVLNQLFRNFPVSFVIQKKQIILKEKEKSSTTSSADMQGFIDGTVKDETNFPIMGATVWLKNSRIGAVTDEDGKFRIQAATGDTLVFSFIGFKTKEHVLGNEKNLVIQLKTDVSGLDQVTVVSTGYQKINKERATGSFSTISGEELQEVPVNNVMHQLEGRVPGLQIEILESDNTFVYDNLEREQEGNTSYNFQIRGQSTIDGNTSPLIVIDGAPTELDIKNINSADVENITFLKDAAAASIYGARAANGVIVIDTKKGKKGKMRINFSHTNTFSTKPSISGLPLMNSSQILDLEQELVDKNIIADPAQAGALYSSYPVSEGVENMLEYERGNISLEEREARLNNLRERNNYNQITKYLMQPASANTYNLSLSGGNNNYNYFTSASYSKEETQRKGSEGEKMTFTINQNFKLFDYADVSTSLKGSFFNFDENGIGLQPLAGQRYSYLPYDRLRDENGNNVSFAREFYRDQITEFEDAGYLPWEYSYLNELENKNSTAQEQNYSANIQVSLPIYKGLNASGTYLIERSNRSRPTLYNEETYYTRNAINSATYLDPATNSITRGLPLGSIYRTNRSILTSQTTRAQLNYNERFKDHAIDAIAGIEFRETREEVSSGTLYGYNEKTQTSVDVVSLNYTTVEGWNSTLNYGNVLTDQRRRFLSYYGNAAYTYKGKYVISGSARLDDYNNFGVDKSYRRTPLWSTGLKWNASKESFLKNIEVINNLSFRASYGFNGNISLTTFPFTKISIANTDYNLSQLPYAFVSAAANPALRWEKTGILNIGVDFGLLDNRISGSLEYYKKNSDDLIQEFPVSEFYGVPNSTLTRNTSTLEGKGVDLSLNGIWIQSKNFTASSNFIFTYNTNEVTDSRFENYSTYLNGSGSTPPIVDYPLNSVFAFRSAGLDENGAFQVYDRNDEIVGPNELLTEIEDMKYMGTRTPKYYGSLNTTLKYKQFSLYVLATYKMGYKLFKPTFDNYISRFNEFTGYNLNTDIADRWREPGDENSTNIPGVLGLGGYSYSRYRLSEDQVISGDHIRLREISLSYDFSKVLQESFIRGASLSFTARNLGLLWRANNDDIDPDFLPYTTGNQIRPTPTAMYSIGLNVNF
ncbi:SusC/RagA family TonB-linked outer membrane protein [Zunongwangia sp. HGR-M22]|uniref:SusC/RagA family TonB-linked outer membrane protein n=1 Tax=Zunongwangia sp. HGR-M22 TaxID=3015168 RepID=UPI0022DE9273|nr:SusC/RagA family TonB-linked outer membrane protein [Zunongwangia sp. HGR-M22]WBL26572.1 SusC/RagA family TonB-linked outer membrane protein [Zunongwangia sp. HGR-M22]